LIGLLARPVRVEAGHVGQQYDLGRADTAAAALAVAFGAAKIVLLTDVAGLYANWPGEQADQSATEAGRPPEVISELTVSDLAAMLPGLSGGMIP